MKCRRSKLNLTGGSGATGWQDWSKIRGILPVSH